MPRILVRHIRPKRQPFDFDEFKKEIINEIDTEVKPDVLQDFKRTQSGWEHSVQFGSRLAVQTNRIALSVFPQGANKEQWKLVSAGSPAHPIFPVRSGGRLSFRAGYLPATKPGRIQSNAKSVFGRRIGAGSIPRHPGFEGRRFPELIADEHKDEFRRRITNSLRRATRRLAG